MISLAKFKSPPLIHVGKMMGNIFLCYLKYGECVYINHILAFLTSHHPSISSFT